jgi:hypothetical protein
VVFKCVIHGAAPVPDQLPEVIWRAGIDLEPIDLEDDDAVRWLETLVWPEEQDRLERLRAAIEIAREAPPRVVRGDLRGRLRELVAEAPAEATLVVFHTAVLAYLSPGEREQFRREVLSTRAEWISNEGADVIAELPLPSVAPAAPSYFVLAANGRRALALCDGHGRWLQWL